jgi:hypothetical protein
LAAITPIFISCLIWACHNNKTALINLLSPSQNKDGKNGRNCTKRKKIFLLPLFIYTGMIASSIFLAIGKPFTERRDEEMKGYRRFLCKSLSLCATLANSVFREARKFSSIGEGVSHWKNLMEFAQTRYTDAGLYELQRGIRQDFHANPLRVLQESHSNCSLSGFSF